METARWPTFSGRRYNADTLIATARVAGVVKEGPHCCRLGRMLDRRPLSLLIQTLSRR